jgi:threonine synthase
LLEVHLGEVDISPKELDKRAAAREFPYDSGVWLFKELIHESMPSKCIVSRREGNTKLYSHKRVSEFAGIRELYLKHEGENPTGSFKDRGMTVGVSEAVRLKAKIVCCASTGNTSASLASYAALAGLKAVVFIPSGEIAYGKLAQSIAYGAKVVQIKGNFDDSMRLIQEAAAHLNMYILNSVNPWRIEGQKAITFELMQQMEWDGPDWIALPAGNLGNTSAMGKALSELKELGFIEKIPRIAAIQSEGANPFYLMWKAGASELVRVKHPDTIASAIKIGNPVSWKKALKAMKISNGVVEQVSDNQILDAKAIIDASGIGCEPASAASLAGVKKLREKGVIKAGQKVVCILTGNILKDPNTTVSYHTNKLDSIKPSYMNPPVEVDGNLDAIMKALKA